MVRSPLTIAYTEQAVAQHNRSRGQHRLLRTGGHRVAVAQRNRSHGQHWSPNCTKLQLPIVT